MLLWLQCGDMGDLRSAATAAGLVSTRTAKLKCHYFLDSSNVFVANKKYRNSEYFVIRVKNLVIFGTLFPVQNRSNPYFYKLK